MPRRNVRFRPEADIWVSTVRRPKGTHWLDDGLNTPPEPVQSFSQARDDPSGPNPRLLHRYFEENPREYRLVQMMFALHHTVEETRPNLQTTLFH
jgi:hypothetical protein